MEFGPTLHCLITFGRLPPQTFHTMKNKTGQFSKSTSCIRKLGFGQSAFSRKINECHFTLIDIIIALISQFLVDAEHKSYIIYLKFHSIFFSLENAMGVSKKTQDKGGYEYAMAVMK